MRSRIPEVVTVPCSIAKRTVTLSRSGLQTTRTKRARFHREIDEWKWNSWQCGLQTIIGGDKYRSHSHFPALKLENLTKLLNQVEFRGFTFQKPTFSFYWKLCQITTSSLRMKPQLFDLTSLNASRKRKRDGSFCCLPWISARGISSVKCEIRLFTTNMWLNSVLEGGWILLQREK